MITVAINDKKIHLTSQLTAYMGLVNLHDQSSDQEKQEYSNAHL